METAKGAEMTVKIGNKEVQLTDYLSANQIQKVLYEAYEQGYQDGGEDMEKAKQIIIDGLLKQIEQIKADAIEEYDRWLSTYNVTTDYYNHRIMVDRGGLKRYASNLYLEQMKEQNNE